VDNVDDVQHDIVKHALKMFGIKSGIEIVSIADIPSGTGLGSSGAFTVALLRALYEFVVHRPKVTFWADTRDQVPAFKRYIAEQASRIEMEKCDKPIGYQDQYASAFGGLNYMTFSKENGIDVQPLDCDTKMLEKRLLLFHTGITRDATVLLTEQQMELRKDDSFAIQFTDIFSTLVKAMKYNLELGHLDIFGDNLHTAWDTKRSITSSITNDRIDEIYKKAYDAGASGGKLCGAGGGGFMLLYAHEEQHQDIRRALKDLKELPFKFEKEGVKLVHCD
jgi:D-glycero-alpha-D-manno-heptose-7-phosphate kinase